MDTDLALLILLLLLSGAFSGAEIALTSLSRAKVRALQEDKKFASKAIVQLKKKPQAFLVTVLIGNNIVNISATVIATMWATRTFGDHVIGLVTGVLTFVILVFGEITPKTLAQKFSVPFARLLAYPLLWLTWLLFPVNWIFLRFTSGLLRVLKIDHHHSQSTSEEEILAMVDIGAEEGVLEEHEQELIENVLEFDETTVEEVMTITKDIDALEAKTGIREAARFFVDHSHSRIPVYKGDLNNIIGIITVHDILRLNHLPTKTENLEQFDYAPVIVVPKTKSIRNLFREFQKRRKHIAMVVDERGDTVGLVTLEDILEEIVGDILDEVDQEVSLVKPIGKNAWEADGEAQVEEVNGVLGTELSYPEHETVSLLILEQLHRFPRLGEEIEYEHVIFKVTEMTKKKIVKVMITRKNA